MYNRPTISSTLKTLACPAHPFVRPVSQHTSRNKLNPNPNCKEKYFKLQRNKTRLESINPPSRREDWLVPENTFIGRPVQHRFNKEKTTISIKAEFGGRGGLSHSNRFNTDIMGSPIWQRPVRVTRSYNFDGGQWSLNPRENTFAPRESADFSLKLLRKNTLLRLNARDELRVQLDVACNKKHEHEREKRVRRLRPSPENDPVSYVMKKKEKDLSALV
ncbi:Oidioi.mRNA.OKI2018_I69.XSR.g14155.t1.cds [Oikopleura dioica]|uniref:Oidioi.mRNA.OKI2018_I69.XSR.g14155.t1.cds n=1 Tax=Oikopleura dioica TaxID=34765 RepID=A0ABN7SF84_OIKDI|nr:Oidioi.mRNA.OKI2018_I69.XSR.g14155.t1.cds [Oikopleura dioica]